MAIYENSSSRETFAEQGKNSLKLMFASMILLDFIFGKLIYLYITTIEETKRNEGTFFPGKPFTL